MSKIMRTNQTLIFGILSHNTASSHANSSKKDIEIQARKSGNVRMGNPGAARRTASMRTPQHPLG